ncbi:phage GP46 family protein [Yersinia kristensenii]|uniref:phage GP46 family protein n=1 Tax=Yersinia kristensenii TaxID=28152 RepID=UPI000B694BE8|nr:phage GP46 family protein [Yersinia kristensenii]MBW5810564.1 phage GP46 family protein [Yersinia kristensenii]MBW5815828.1 phage GP46 family protein [Yersinia kristensenii]MBW5823637.1 phage GP46 family protein [Yersinia kristensenii]MBW5828005.1 phage GP46 family protein [Yersinia kristensenii]MBW5840726.1 phage GP46 family protein [Yersinia kristensenii]
MTTDIKTVWDVDASLGDWRAGHGGLLDGDDLHTAILLSLFTDRLARSDDDIDGDDRRGWWGDSGAASAIGSRLWLLRRQKLTTQVAIKAEDYAAEALAWLIEDAVVASISIRTQIIFPNKLLLLIDYQQPGQTQSAANHSSIKFSWVWEE